MERVLWSYEMRECDRYAIENIGIPGVVLMENAGREAFIDARRLLEQRKGKRAIIYCGPGNNGGDGFVVARYLHEAGVPVLLLCLKEPSKLKGDAAVNAKIAGSLGIPILTINTNDDEVELNGWVELEPTASCSWQDLQDEYCEDPRDILEEGDLVVDALLGTGIDKKIYGPIADLVGEIGYLKSIGCSVLSLDLPSGVCSDTGRVMGTCVEADVTVTFGYLKRGLVLNPGASAAGQIRVADIGLPRDVESCLESPSCVRLLEDDIRTLLPQAPFDSHKGIFGHVLVLAGSKNLAGAASLVCEGSLRAGAGLVTLATRPGGDLALRSRVPEAMGIYLEGDGPLGRQDLEAVITLLGGKNVVAIGPGIPRGPETGELIKELMERSSIPLVIDADGINAIDSSVLGGARRDSAIILTPHPREMARLIDRDLSYVQGDRLGVAASFAQKHQVYLVLKGNRTVIADPDGSLAICERGGPELATGGSGDVLTGIIAALIASGLSPSAACRVGVYAHAVAGEVACSRYGRAGTLASDVAYSLGTVWQRWGW